MRKRLFAGSAAVAISLLGGLHSLYLGLIQMLTMTIQIAVQFNHYTTAMTLATMLLILLRGPVLVRVAWGGVITTFKRMHFLYGGIILVLFSAIVLSLLPGIFIVSTLTALFSSGALTLSGLAIVQGFLFLLGVVFVVFDFPFGQVKAMRGRRRM